MIRITVSTDSGELQADPAYDWFTQSLETRRYGPRSAAGGRYGRVPLCPRIAQSDDRCPYEDLQHSASRTNPGPTIRHDSESPARLFPALTYLAADWHPQVRPCKANSAMPPLSPRLREICHREPQHNSATRNKVLCRNSDSNRKG